MQCFGKSCKMSNIIRSGAVRGLRSCLCSHKTIYEQCHIQRNMCYHARDTYSRNKLLHFHNVKVPVENMAKRHVMTSVNLPNIAKEKQEIIQKKKAAKREALLQRQKQKESNVLKNTFTYDVPTALGKKKDITCELPPSYSPAYVEAVWYNWWEKQGYFQPEYMSSEKGTTFTIVLPPPNVTGSLHLGHALGTAVEDAIVRWHRMMGRRVLWLPGCDHAGIATQVVVEKALQRQGKSRHDLGREAFTEAVWEWKNQKGDRIYEQLKCLGASLDWSRETFTLDPHMARAVTAAFIRLHREGLIHRATRLTNWCSALRSAVSDVEVDSRAVEGRTEIMVPGYEKPIEFGLMYEIEYQVEGSDERVAVATTRPETMLGDVALVVHPEDQRYRHLHGRHVLHPLYSEESERHKLPVLADDMVDRELGTGVVKITPAHDANDHAVGLRHGLPTINILDDKGCMVNVPQEFVGLPRFHARHAVLDALSSRGLYQGVARDHNTVLPVCSRTGDIIEPRLLPQWYLDCTDMAHKARQVVESGELELIPDHFSKSWHQWLSTGPQQWCISRQLWWGHHIPVYRVMDTHGQVVSGCEWVVGEDYEQAMTEAVEKTGLDRSQLHLQQDEDVLDTWFSSALFPFASLGWPENTSDLTQFYPTSLLETASDILFFWVARMVMLGQKLTGELPFKQVLFHSILRDAHGRKMSKSLGNVIDPMDVIQGISLEKLHDQVGTSNLSAAEIQLAVKGQQRDFPMGIPQCGADALRFTLLNYSFKAHFTNVDVQHIASTRRFCNKIWQAFRFCQPHIQHIVPPAGHYQLNGSESATDLWLLSRLSHLVDTCHSAFSTYDLNLATQALHQFITAEFCDVYLEYAKVMVKQSQQIENVENDHRLVEEAMRKESDSTDLVQKDNSDEVVKRILFLSLDTMLRVLNPFMPYISEELYQRLRPDEKTEISTKDTDQNLHWAESICVARYPLSSDFPFRNDALQEDMECVQRIVNSIQACRRNFSLTKARQEVIVHSQNRDIMRALGDHKTTLLTLSRSADVKLVVLDGGGKQDKEMLEGCVACKDDEEATVYVKLKGLIDVEEEMTKQEKQLTKYSEQLEKTNKKLLSYSLPMHVEVDTQEKVKKLTRDIERLETTLQMLKELRD